MRTYYYILSILILLVSCNKEIISPVNEIDGVIIKLVTQQNIHTRVIDGDNPASEQIIRNLSLYLTEPGSTTITARYVYIGFSNNIDYQIVTLPVEPEELLSKDIYVIANFDNENTLNQISSTTEFKELHTPEVNKSNNLNPINGFCMFGSTLDFDFTSGGNAIVNLIRTCAKIRVNLVFPENYLLSTDNSFLIQNAATYTFVSQNPTSILLNSEYFTFAAPIALAFDNSQTYTNVTYIYEASNAALITFYTHINNTGEEQEFTAKLPIPKRNYLYELNVEIYEEEETATRSEKRLAPDYNLKSTVTIYNEKGEKVDE